MKDDDKKVKVCCKGLEEQKHDFTVETDDNKKSEIYISPEYYMTGPITYCPFCSKKLEIEDA